MPWATSEGECFCCGKPCGSGTVCGECEVGDDDVSPQSSDG